MAATQRSQSVCVFMVSGVLALGIACCASADLILVPNDYPTIQEAIDAASDGDEISVAPGAYVESINLLGKAIWLHSSNGPDMTTIDANGTYHVVQCVNGEGPDTILEGFTITGGEADGSGDNGYGGGMLNVSASPTVSNCIFEWNSANYGGGMLSRAGSAPSISSCVFQYNAAANYGGGMENYDDSNPEITDCTFAENTADYGGGMINHTWSSPSIANCLFESNAATTYGGGMENYDHSSPTLTSCTFIGNDAEYGGGLLNSTTSWPQITNCLFEGNNATLRGGAIDNYDTCSPEITNCTFSGNTAGDLGGAIYNYYDSDPTVTNCILWGDTPDEIANVDFCDPIVTWCDVQGGHAGEGNIDTDPIFVSPAEGDLRLDRYSPCIDAGDNDAVPFFVTTDLDGNPRFVDDAGVADTGSGTPPIVDMGAYERQEDSAIAVPTQFATIQEAILASSDGYEIIVAPGTYPESIDFLGRAIWLHSSDGAALTTIDGSGAYHVVQCVNGEDPDTILEGFTITGGNAGGSGDDGYGGGMLNISASPTVIDCIFEWNTAEYGGGMLNSTGSAPSIDNCVFENNTATTYGGGMENYDDSSPTIIDCTFADNTAYDGGGMFNTTGSAPSIIHCVFENNSASGTGGGMWNFDSSHPTLTSCIFAGNTADYGGGMGNSSESSPSITDCVFENNSASKSGGGMWNYNYSNPTLTNCTFSGNIAAGFGWGGAIYNNVVSSPTLTNCTFTGNTALNVGGAIYNYNISNPTLTNCILWGDTPDEIASFDCTPVVTWCDVQGGYAGEGNIDACPLFVNPMEGDLRLYRFSPCTDAGNNDAVPPGVTTDLDGNPRFVDDAGVSDTGSGTPPIVDMGAYERQEESVGGFTVTVPGDFPTIQEAIYYCSHGDEIIVAPGTYVEAIDFAGREIWLHSSDGAALTTIDGSGAYHVVQCVNGEGPGAILEGFTITGGEADGSGYSGYGGGMLNVSASPTVIDCIFTGNTANYGGGMLNSTGSSPSITNCLFESNTADFRGGAIDNYISSSPTLTNCTFTGNTALEMGGAIYNYNGSNPTLTNCILWGDAPDEIVNVESSNPIVTWCDIQGGYSGEGNIDVPPLFVNPSEGDLRLHRFSPCADAGNNDAVPPDVTTDLDGNPRFVDDAGVPDTGWGSAPIVDMGAYERQEDSVGASTVTVPGDFGTIQEAIFYCSHGDEIIVAPGTYFEAIDFAGRELWLHSSDGAAVTTIDAAGAYHVVQCIYGEGPGAILEGFTITGGNAHGSGDDAYGGGMLNVSASPTVIDCIFASNTANSGGGMLNFSASPTVSDCIFAGNTANYGGGMLSRAGSSPSITGCLFENNTAINYGGGMENDDDSNPEITDCIFAGNTAGDAGAMYNYNASSPAVTNCLFESNSSAQLCGGMYNRLSSVPIVLNCLFVENDHAAMLNQDLCDATIVNCTITANGSGIENNASDPVITNCILWGDAGSEISEFWGSAPIVTWCDVQGGYDGEGNIDAHPRFVNPMEGDLRLYRFSPCIDAGNNDAVPPDVTTDLDGNSRFIDDAGVEDTGYGTPPIVDMGAYERQEESVGGLTVTVPGDFATIQEAILYCSHGDEIVVAPGTYVEAIDFAGKSIWLHSSDGAAATTIDGAGAYHVVQCVNGEGPGAVLEGFTITGGNAHGSGDDAYGGGMLNVSASPTVIDCTFAENTANYGGGMLNSTGSSPSITNCLFENNMADFRGGAMDNYISSSPTLTNCTFTGNTAVEMGGAIYNYSGSNPTVTNCILWADAPDEIANFSGSDPIVTWCDIQGGYDGEGNIDADPRFANPMEGDLRLDRFSPCIDGGNNEELPDGVDTDLGGNPRFVDDAGVADTGVGFPCVDLGAYERQENSVNFTVTVPGDFGTIQEAIEYCLSGDEIIVAPGTYFEAIDFAGRELWLHSSDGAAVTTIDAAGAYHVVQCVSGEGPGAILEGFTITGGNANGSGDNGYGGGMLNVSASPTVLDCIFTGNSARWGGGMLNRSGSSPSITNCVFESNAAVVWGGGMENWDSCSPALTNCMFIGNTADHGGGMDNYIYCSPSLINCTFTGNTALDVGGGIYSTASGPMLTNCILWGDTPNEITSIDSTPILTWCDVQGGYEGEGNIDACPLFVNPAEGDLRLHRFSPCVDAGNNDAVPDDVVTDLDGNPRFVDDAGVADTGWGTPPIVDMGAYERQEDSVGGSTVTVPGDFPTIQEAIYYCSHGDEIIVAPDTYSEAIDFAGREIWLHSSDGAAATTIDAGGAYHGVQCVSGEGPCAVLQGFTITGGNANGSGDDAYGGGMLNVAASPTVIDCIFTGNTANYGGGMLNRAGSEPSIDNCLFENNSAVNYGGGMENYDSSDPTITDCTFAENTADYGGGMLNSTGSSPSITNCLFENNTADFRGGGMDNYIGCCPTLTNCTFSGNTAQDTGGGIYNYQDSNPTVTNCILWGDAPDEIENVIYSYPTVTWCDVQGGYNGEGNIDVDPLFLDPEGGDYHLGAGSPCIDAANNEAVPEGIDTDLDGNPRFVDDPDTDDTGYGTPPIVDMGAYEYQIEESCPADFDDDGDVDTADLLHLLACWGADCGDVDGDDDTDTADLLALLAAWGECP